MINENKNSLIIKYNNEIKLLQEQIEKLDNEYFNGNPNGINYKDVKLLWKKIEEFHEKILKLEGYIYSNDTLALYLDKDANKVGEFCETFLIYLKDEDKFIGKIRVTYDNMKNNFLGNIGYEIYEGYRGHGYTLKALNMLRGHMYQKGLTKPIINTKTDNSYSINIIQKFGGKKIEDENLWYQSYEVDLNKHSKNK